MAEILAVDRDLRVPLRLAIRMIAVCSRRVTPTRAVGVGLRFGYRSASDFGLGQTPGVPERLPAACRCAYNLPHNKALFAIALFQCRAVSSAGRAADS